jgi:predicted metal-dependent hydrolase
MLQFLDDFIVGSPSKLILKRCLLYLKNRKFQPSDASAILKAALTQIPRSGKVIIRDVRVADRFIEFDLSVSDQEILDQVVIKALSSIGDMDNFEMLTEENFSKEEGIDRARDLFNDERFWRCHEILEGIWKRSEGEEKRLLNGVILVAAAFVHFQKGENETCISILRRAHDKIRSGRGEYHGIKLDLLLENLTSIIETGIIVRLRL